MHTVEKVAGGRVYVRPLGQALAPGDRVDVDRRDLLEHLTETRGDFAIVDDVSGASGTDSDGVATPFNPGEYTLAELETALAAVDDTDALDAIEAAERDGKDRTGAYDHIDDRRDALEA